MSTLRLFLLGSPRIEIDGAPVVVDTRKAVALLVYLVMTGEIHNRDSLATLLWPEYDSASARAAFRRTLSALRKALKNEWLETSREMVGLKASLQLWVDVHHFHQILAHCALHGHPVTEICSACVPLLEQAAEIHRDDFLSGFTLRDSPNFDEWQFFQTESLRRELSSVLEKLIRSLSALGELERAIHQARRWLALDSLMEEAHRYLMLLYSWSGQRNAALRQYRECVRILDRELGVSPLVETTELYQAILEGRPIPRQEMPLAPPLSEPERKPATPPPSRGAPLIARREQWESLRKAYDHNAPSGYLVALEGEPGIGKTRLAEEFVAHTKDRGAVTVVARCYQGETNLAYGPFLEVFQTLISQPERLFRLQGISPHSLSEASRLIPDLAALPLSIASRSTAQTNEDPGAQARFFEGLRQVLIRLFAGAAPGVMVIDDLQWADDASLNLLNYLVRRLRGSALFILVTWRREGLPSNHRLVQLITEVQRSGTGRIITLSRFKPHEIEDLVRAVLRPGVELPGEFSERLYQESEGLPYFAVEYLGGLGQGADGIQDWTMPHNVRDLLLSRLAGLGETEQQLLSTAAVIGRSFDFQTLKEASGRSELETITGLETLQTAGLIEERLTGNSTAVITYDFTHDKLRALVYEETSRTRRRLLHRRVAEALAKEARSQREPNLLDSQVAYHYHVAGQEELATDYYRLAGDFSRGLFATVEAITHYQSALTFGHPEPSRLHEAIGDLRVLLGEYRKALTSYETAAALTDCLNPPRLEHKIGSVHHRLGEWDLAISYFQAALEAIESQAETPGLAADKASLFADWSRTAHNQGQAHKAIELAGQALELARLAGDDEALAQAHNILGILARNEENPVQACEHLQRSLDIAGTFKDPTAQIAALNNLALVYSDLGEWEQAVRSAQSALDLCTLQGDRHREAALHNNLADLYHASGQTELAMSHLKKAVVLFSEIGIEAGIHQPEIWKLTEW